MTGTFDAALRTAAADVQACFDRVLTGHSDLPVIRAMGYATRGGKRLRGFLVLESAALHGVARGDAIWCATAIEALHAYSLVHDDLPCMDDDDLRRGQPTVHRAFDEGTAVLVGDALQALAFDLVTRAEGVAAARRLDLVASLARAAGMAGMVLGQAQDIAAESAAAPLTLEAITELQANKTGALIRWSAEAGARMAGADPAPLTIFATALGLAFQIADDILDVEGDADAAGKRLRKDEAAGKATFVSLLGLEAARARATSLAEEACDALAPYGDRAAVLKDAARFVVTRKT